MFHSKKKRWARSCLSLTAMTKDTLSRSLPNTALTQKSSGSPWQGRWVIPMIQLLKPQAAVPHVIQLPWTQDAMWVRGKVQGWCLQEEYRPVWWKEGSFMLSGIPSTLHYKPDNISSYHLHSLQQISHFIYNLQVCFQSQNNKIAPRTCTRGFLLCSKGPF